MGLNINWPITILLLNISYFFISTDREKKMIPSIILSLFSLIVVPYPLHSSHNSV